MYNEFTYYLLAMNLIRYVDNIGKAFAIQSGLKIAMHPHFKNAYIAHSHALEDAGKTYLLVFDVPKTFVERIELNVFLHKHIMGIERLVPLKRNEIGVIVNCELIHDKILNKQHAQQLGLSNATYNVIDNHTSDHCEQHILRYMRQDAQELYYNAVNKKNIVVMTIPFPETLHFLNCIYE
jgi:hypothetical protein